jgi:hypothetical protein
MKSVWYCEADDMLAIYHKYETSISLFELNENLYQVLSVEGNKVCFFAEDDEPHWWVKIGKF